MNYKAIILIIASNDIRIPTYEQPHFPILKQALNSYIHTNPNIKTFFVYGSDTKFEPQSYDLVYNFIPESHGLGMLAKTLEAIKYINNHYNYDFLIRTNLSQFWILDRLLLRLNQLPRTQCITGTRVNNPTHIAGWDLHLSKDMTEILLNYKNKILEQGKTTNLEDQVMCNTLKKYTNIPFTNSTLPDYTYKIHPLHNITEPLTIPDNIDHIRFKLKNRNHEKILVQHLIKKFYNIDFIPKYPAI